MTLMRIGDAHDMPAGIRIAVEDHEGVLAAKENQVIEIPVRRSRQTKDTAFNVFIFLDILHTPWCPNMVQNGRVLFYL
jgi:hypothetical protein